MFCGYCGKSLPENVKFCPYCNMPVEDEEEVNEDKTIHTAVTTTVQEPDTEPVSLAEPTDSVYQADPVDTEETGEYQPAVIPVGIMPDENPEEKRTVVQQIEIPQTITDTTEQIKKAGTAVLGKAAQAVSNINSKKTVLKTPGMMKKESEGPVGMKYSGQNFMSQSKMWSWLKRESRRQQYYVPEGTDESEQSYMYSLQQKLEDNMVPAVIERKEVTWDNSTIRQSIYRIKPSTEVVDPVAYMIQFNTVGKFVFVEEKTFIYPPDLPERPGELVPENNNPNLMLMMGMGCLLVVAGLALGFNLVLILIGLALLAFGYLSGSSARQAREHNAKVLQDRQKWNAAWRNWEDSIFTHSFQEDVNGRLSRIHDAVYGCIKQVNEEKFGDKTVNEDDDSTSMAELRSLIADRKDEYK